MFPRAYFLMLLAAFLLAGCAEAQPEFVSKGEKFAARFRGVPERKVRSVGTSPSVVYSVESRDGADTVSVTELPLKGGEPPEMVPWVLNSAKAGLLREAGGKVLSESNVTLAGKYPGREFSAAVTEPRAGVSRTRIYFANGRLYRVAVMGTPDYANGEAATAFLDSFRLTE